MIVKNQSWLQLKRIFLLILIVPILQNCGGGGGNAATGGNSNSTVAVQGQLAVASGDEAAKYTVFNANQSSIPSSSGSFSTAVAKDSPTYTYAISGTGKKVYAAVNAGANGSSMTINAQSTAEAMVLLSPLLIPDTGDARTKIVNIVKSDAAVKALATVIDRVYGSVQDPLADPRIADALTNAVKSVLTTWQTANISSAKALGQTMRKSSALADAAVKAAGSSSMQAYPFDMGALTLAGSTGSTLRLGLNNVGIGGITTNVDWVVRIVELDPAKIQWSQSGVPVLGDPTSVTNIDSLIKTGGYDQITIIEGAVGSGLLKFVVDPMGQVADSISATVFPDAGITLPHDGVYAVMALSGSPFGDAAEYNSVISSAWQKSLWAEAAAMNIASAAIDVVGVGTSFANAAGAAVPDISPILEGELAVIKTELTANPNYVGAAGITYFVGKTADLGGKLLDYLKPYIHSSISDLQSAGLKQFFHVAVNTAESVVGVWSGTVSAGSRVLNYLYNVTPRESGYAVLGAFGGQIPSLPTGFAVMAASPSEIDLSWNASIGNVTGYKVYKSGTYLKSVATTSASDTWLNPGTNYCYYVTAYNSAGESAPTSQLCATTSSVSYQNYVIQPGPTDGMDTFFGTVYITSGAPSAEELSIGGWADFYYGFLEFNLNGSPSADKTVSATLYLYGHAPVGGSDPGLQINRITNSWTEAGVTLANNPGSVFYKNLGPFAIGADVWNSVDITDLYKNWKNGIYPNYGIKLVPTNNLHSNGSIASSNNVDGTIRPKIVISYSPSSTLYSLSGKVTLNGSGLSGVTVSLTGAAAASTATDGSGNYILTNLQNGNYTITPTLSGYNFSPTSKAVTVNSANAAGQNFIGTTLPAGYVSQGGLTWMPSTSVPVNFGLTFWEDANAYCTNTIINGQTGWRLPTENELLSLANSGALNAVVNQWVWYYVWSSTPYPTGGYYVVYLDPTRIFNGTVNVGMDPGYVTCVR